MNAIQTDQNIKKIRIEEHKERNREGRSAFTYYIIVYVRYYILVFVSVFSINFKQIGMSLQKKNYKNSTRYGEYPERVLQIHVNFSFENISCVFESGIIRDGIIGHH